MAIANQRNRLRPFQRGAFSLGEKRRFPPGVECVQALLGLTRGPRVFGVHIDAVGAAVDLGRPDFYKLAERRFEARGLVDIVLQSAHRIYCLRGRFVEIESGFHPAHSYRRASIGSSRDAFSAGRKPANNPMASSTAVDAITANRVMCR